MSVLTGCELAATVSSGANPLTISTAGSIASTTVTLSSATAPAAASSTQVQVVTDALLAIGGAQSATIAWPALAKQVTFTVTSAGGTGTGHIGFAAITSTDAAFNNIAVANLTVNVLPRSSCRLFLHGI